MISPSLEYHNNANLQDNTSVLPIRIYLGSSFDPVHFSHIAMLKHVYNSLTALQPSKQNSKIKASFLPTSRSPLKHKATDPIHRLAMLQSLQFNQQYNVQPKDLFNFEICDYELWQDPPTYSIDTLRYLHNKYPNSSLIFIIGADNIASLAKWRDGEKLINHAHLWVFPRDKYQSLQDIRALLPDSLKSRITTNPKRLTQTKNGSIFIDTKVVNTISSSIIRKAFADNRLDEAKSALPHSVYSYIIENNLYHTH